MKRKYTSYVLLGVLATFVLLLSVSPTMASTVSIYTNPSGATVTVDSIGPYAGTILGTTTLTFDPTKYPNTPLLRITKSGYYPITIGMPYTSVSFTLKQSTITTKVSMPAPTSTPAPVSAPAPAPAPKSGTFVDSRPQGAAVYIIWGVNDGKYLGTTPFTYDFSALGPVYIQFVKTGYKFTWAQVYPSYPSLTAILNT